MSTLLWFLGVLIYFYMPGDFLLKYMKVEENEYFFHTFLSIALGLAFTPLVYKICRIMSIPGGIYAVGFLAVSLWIYHYVRRRPNDRNSSAVSGSEIWNILLISIIAMVLLHLSHFTDVLISKEGIKIRTTAMTETLFHLGIVNMLTDTYPLSFPYASGVDFSHYHINMHLGIELFNRVFSIDSLYLTFFFFPFLYFLLLIIIPYYFVKRNLRDGLLGIVAGVLVFGADLSFIPGLLGRLPDHYPWTLCFTTSIWSLLTLNGILPASIVMFLSFVYLKRYIDSGRNILLVLFAFLVYSAFGYKSSMGPHIAGAGIILGIVMLFDKNYRGKSFPLLSVCIITFGLVTVDIFLLKTGVGKSTVKMDILNVFFASLRKLKITHLPVYVFPFAFITYVVASYGTRFWGIVLLKHMFRKETRDLFLVFLIIFSVMGFCVSELFRVKGDGGSGNNAVWFAVQSLIAAWLLIPYFLAQIKPNKQKYIVMIFLIMLLSFPTTLQFLSLRYDWKYTLISSEAMEVVQYLRSTPANSIVLHPPNVMTPSLASNLAGRVSVLNIFRSFSSSQLGQKEYAERLSDIRMFFKEDADIDRSKIIKKYGVNYVYAPVKYAGLLDEEMQLVPVFRGNEYAVYKVILVS